MSLTIRLPEETRKLIINIKRENGKFTSSQKRVFTAGLTYLPFVILYNNDRVLPPNPAELIPEHSNQVTKLEEYFQRHAYEISHDLFVF